MRANVRDRRTVVTIERVAASAIEASRESAAQNEKLPCGPLRPFSRWLRDQFDLGHACCAPVKCAAAVNRMIENKDTAGNARSRRDPQDGRVPALGALDP